MFEHLAEDQWDCTMVGTDIILITYKLKKRPRFLGPAHGIWLHVNDHRPGLEPVTILFEFEPRC